MRLEVENTLIIRGDNLSARVYDPSIHDYDQLQLEILTTGVENPTSKLGFGTTPNRVEDSCGEVGINTENLESGVYEIGLVRLHSPNKNDLAERIDFLPERDYARTFFEVADSGVSRRSQAELSEQIKAKEADIERIFLQPIDLTAGRSAVRREYAMFVLMAILFPLVVFALIGLTVGKSVFDLPTKKRRLQHFLLAEGQASKSEFIQSSVAYNLQIYITFFFVFWGYRYGYSNIFYILSWFIGILLFTLSASKLLVVKRKWITVVALVAQDHKIIRVLCSLVALIFFVSLIYRESYYTAHFLSALSGDEFGIATSTWWTYFTLIILVSLSYSLYGGLPKIYLTDKMQLSLAYIGIGVLITFLGYQAQIHSSSSSFEIILIGCGIYAVLLINSVKCKAPLYLLLSLLVPLFLLISMFSVEPIDKANIDLPGIPSLFAQINEDYGWFTLLGFTLTNLLWQFGDPSNYQRIASLHLETEQDDKVVESEIKRVLWSTSIASPLTWSFGILIGMAAAAAGIEADFFGENAAIISFLRETATLDWVAVIVIVLFGAAVVSIMLSTVDSSILAFSEVFLLDFELSTELNYRQLVIIGMSILVIVFGIAFLHVGLNTTTIERLVGWSAAQIPLIAPAVICRLFMRNCSWWLVLTSILLGFLALAISAFYPLDWNDNILLGLPMVAGIGVSTTIVFIGNLVSRWRS